MRVVHISELRRANLSEADRELAIAYILGIMMEDGGTDESADEALSRAFEVEDPKEYWMNHEALRMLALGRPEYAGWIAAAYRRRRTKMTELQRQEFDQNFDDMLAEMMPLIGTRLKQEGIDEGRQETHVRLLFRLLRRRGIELAREDKLKLEELSCADLPDILVADDAADAEDFARRAGLR